MADFNSSKEVVTLGLSLYVLGLGTGPMFLAPLSEFMADDQFTLFPGHSLLYGLFRVL